MSKKTIFQRAKAAFGLGPLSSLAAQKESINEEYREKAMPKRVLMADDDSMAIGLLAAVTRDFRYELIAKNTVDETIAFLETMESLAGAILDGVFLNGDGVQIYLWISKNRPDLNVAFLTQFKNQAMAELIREIGPARVFDKRKLGEIGYVEQLMLQLGVDRKVSVDHLVQSRSPFVKQPPNVLPQGFPESRSVLQI